MEIPSRLDRRHSSSRFFVNSDPPINYNPWNKRFSPVDPDCHSESTPYFHRPPHRGPHPYQRSQPARRPQAQVTPTTSSSSDQIPSLLTMEIPPRPLIPPETVERLRASLRTSVGFSRRLKTETYDDYDDWPAADDCADADADADADAAEEDYYTRATVIDECTGVEEGYYSPPNVDEQFTEEEYLREEQKTKQQIEEIIAVAQALREKLDREEELRRQAELQQQQPQQPIPKLMDLKPKIPSLLEIYAPPPPELPEEMCWNCRRPGHTFTQCKRKFCYRCGTPGFDIGSCPTCHNNSR